MIITPLKTKIFLPPKGDLLALINEGLSGRKLKEKSILFQKGTMKLIKL